MRTEFKNVRPIRPGFDATIAIVYDPETWAAEIMNDGVLRAQFRPTVDSTSVLFEATTADGSIIREPASRKLSIIIPALSTAGFSEPQCVFDFVRLGDPVTTVPGRWIWPVRRTVTANE